jgi:putative aldouronate transport system substrate-binding protein
MKKLVYFVLFMVFCCGLLVAGGNQAGGNAAASGQLAEITWLVWDRGTLPASQGTLDDNWWTKYVNEQVASLGAKVKFIKIPREQDVQLLSTMLAANNAPDLSATGDLPLLKTYISGGGVSDMTPYFEKFGSNIKALYGDAILNDIKYDGKLYYLPHLQNGMDTRTTWIRKDWLDAIGMDIPSTPDEFYQVLKAIKEKDPGKVGRNLIPLAMMRQNFTFWNEVVLPGFVKDLPTPERLLVPFIMWPEARDALQYLNKLFNEGLLTDQLILDKDDSLFRQKIARGEPFAFIAHGHYPYHSAYGQLYDKVREITPNAVITSVYTFRKSRNDPKVNYWGSNPYYGYRWFTPASSKHPEIAFKIFDWASSSAGYEVGGLGILGTDYTMVNGVPTPINRDQYLARVPWIEPQYHIMAKPFPNPKDKELFLENYAKDFNPVYFPQIKAEAVFLCDQKYFPPTISVPTPQSDKLSPAVADYMDNQISKIITAPVADFDKIFADTVKTYREMGGDAIVEEALRLYKK